MRDVYSAIADPTRREIIRLLGEADELSLHELVGRFDIGRTAVSKHLAVLRDAGLVTDRKVGRETRYRLDPTPLRQVQQWVATYEPFWTDRLARLKTLMEAEDHD